VQFYVDLCWKYEILVRAMQLHLHNHSIRETF